MLSGWPPKAASRFEKTPAAAMYALPLPPSSPGHPRTLTVPDRPVDDRYSLTASAAATAPAPYKWWPQPWPWGSPASLAGRTASGCWLMSERASNSAMKPTSGLPEPNDATNAVGRPATFSSIAKPLSFKYFLIRAAERSSWNASSGVFQTPLAKSVSSELFRSITSRYFASGMLILSSSICEIYGDLQRRLRSAVIANTCGSSCFLRLNIPGSRKIPSASA